MHNILLPKNSEFSLDEIIEITDDALMNNEIPPRLRRFLKEIQNEAFEEQRIKGKS